MVLLEREFKRIESQIVTALETPKDFLYVVHQAWNEFIRTVRVLANTPRLRYPVWLSILEGDEGVVASPFCETLASLVCDLDKKETYFFLSNLISTVLMHHISWVASVAPTVLKRSTSTSISASEGSLTMSKESNFSPYNIHMTQYLEVFGNIGSNGVKVRTLVTGEKEQIETVSRILHVLSYFVRCSGIKQRSGESTTPIYDIPVEEVFFPTTSPYEAIIAKPLRSNDRNAKSSPNKVSDLDRMISYYSNCPQVAVWPNVASDIGQRHPREREPLLDGVGIENEKELNRCLGRSLLVGPCSAYSLHFVLSGILKNDLNSETDILHRLRENLAIESFDDDFLYPRQSSSSDLSFYQMNESIIVLADISDWSVKVLSTSKGVERVASPSEAIVSMMEQFVDLKSAGFAPKFLLSHLENSLQELFGKSQALVDIISSPVSANDSNLLNPERVRDIVDCDVSDLRLLLNVAAVYSPSILESFD